MSNQPDDLSPVFGVILTCGLNVNGDRCAIVLPLVYDSDDLPPTSLCQDCANSFVTQIVPGLMGCVAPSVYLQYITCDGFLDGKVPYRQDFVPTAHVGTLETLSAPSQVAGLIFFYEDPADNPDLTRMRVAKNFIPGIPSNLIVGDIMTGDLTGPLNDLASNLQQGFESTFNSAQKWWRVLAAPKTRSLGETIRRTAVFGVRGKVKTQRRRLVPI